MNSRAVQVRVVGRVQGVGFRQSTRARAQRLGITGWVRNSADGTVEAWLEGPSDAVEAMIDWLDEGPSYAHVRNVKVAERPLEGHREFEVRR